MDFSLSLGRKVAFCSALATGIVAMVGCQSTADPPASSNIGTIPKGGGGTTDPATNPDGGGAGSCSTTELSGSAITEYYIDEAAPAMIGGTITAGTYALTQASLYTGVGGNAGPTGTTYEETRTFNDTSYTDLSLVTEEDAGSGSPSATSGTFTASGSTLTLTTSCPDVGGVFTFPYSVDGTTIHIMVTSTSERVFTQQ